MVQTIYNIVKAHGGEIKVETPSADLDRYREIAQARKVDEGNPDHFGKGGGTTFIIQLPE